MDAINLSELSSLESPIASVNRERFGRRGRLALSLRSGICRRDRCENEIEIFTVYAAGGRRLFVGQMREVVTRTCERYLYKFAGDIPTVAEALRSPFIFPLGNDTVNEYKSLATFQRRKLKSICRAESAEHRNLPASYIKQKY